jgi:hypothetical protein
MPMHMQSAGQSCRTVDQTEILSGHPLLCLRSALFAARDTLYCMCGGLSLPFWGWMSSDLIDDSRVTIDPVCLTVTFVPETITFGTGMSSPYDR